MNGKSAHPGRLVYNAGPHPTWGGTIPVDVPWMKRKVGAAFQIEQLRIWAADPKSHTPTISYTTSIGPDLHTHKSDGRPHSIKGRDYKIAEILSARQKLDFKRAWWRRRHRDYYLVRTDSGQIFELYFHRGPGRKYWVLYREV